MELQVPNSHRVNTFMEEHKKAPLFDAMRDYIAKDMSAYHTPGHKQGKGADPEFLELMGINMLKMDLCELPEVDNLHDAVTVIKEAQELAASAFSADKTFFLVNGSTTGNNVMVMTVCDPGDKIIIPRNIHKSILGGIILSGAIPVYVPAMWDEELGIAHGVDVVALEQALIDNPDVKGVLVVNPTYYGVTTDLKKVVDLVHKYNRPVLVDEAHGAHFHFHDDLPVSALKAGADMVVQSTHKILTSMTQSSMLHVREGRVNIKRAKNVLQLLHSTSPSYVLLASLDVARRQMVLHGKELLQRTIDLADDARRRLNEIPGISCFGKEKCGKFGIYDVDLTKLVINFSGIGLSGFHALDILDQKYNVQSEMATLYTVLELVTVGNDQRDLDRLVDAVRDIAEKGDFEKDLRVETKAPPIPAIPKSIMTPREAFFAPTEKVPFANSIGRVCAEIVSPYPPGIPILAPGEEITENIVDYLQLIYNHGAFINGPEDVRLHTIKVIRD
ncbi:MAG: aminotransferase class I/II-fold pyridoxal phosphate-dependent enzyme [Candidatus Sericytochromatia bacterium]|nr:aminotransferase class I/II-fold pyridoxal phosphate-dependent enzyme [Candidatus Sericytochromatia bacterium]